MTYLPILIDLIKSNTRHKKMKFHNKMIRRACAMTALLAVSVPSFADKYGYPDFAIGADISWYTQMADQGVRMLDADGNPTTAPDLMASYNMDAVRLRVFVDPSSPYGYNREMGAGGSRSYCDIDDVVAKALAAKERRQRVMLCVHFSDNWADPSKQRLPQSWSAFTTAGQMAEAAASHVTGVLSALRHAGVHVEWVQLGNETRSGMLYQRPDGTDISSAQHTAKVLKNPVGAQNFVKIFSAANDAAKAIYPDVKTMVMLDDAPNLSRYVSFFNSTGTSFDFDYVGMSLYPVDEKTFLTDGWKTNVDKALETIAEVYKRYGKRTILCEIGMPTAWSKVDGVDQMGEAAVAAQCSKDVRECLDYIIPRLKASTCDGIFYWEPQSYNFNNYNKGALTYEGKPNGAWDAMRDNQQPGFTLSEVSYPEISGDAPSLPPSDGPDDTPALSTYYLQIEKEWPMADTSKLFMATSDPMVFTLSGVEIGDLSAPGTTTRLTVVDRVDDTNGRWYYADYALNPGGFGIEPGVPFKMRDNWLGAEDGDAILPAPGIYDVVWDSDDKTLLFTHASQEPEPDNGYWFLVGLNDWAEPIPLGGTGDGATFKAYGVEIEAYKTSADGYSYGNDFGVVRSASEDTADIDWTNIYGGGDANGWTLDLANKGLVLTPNTAKAWAWSPLRGTYDVVWNPSTATIEFDTRAHALYIAGEYFNSWKGVGQRLDTYDGHTYTVSVNELSGDFILVEAEVSDAPGFEIDWDKGVKLGVADGYKLDGRGEEDGGNFGFVDRGTYRLTEVTTAEGDDVRPMTTRHSGDVVMSLAGSTFTLEYEPGARTGILTVTPPIASGVEEVGDGESTDQDAPVEYFDLNGRRIAEPTAPGIYIRRQGSTATKVSIR